MIFNIVFHSLSLILNVILPLLLSLPVVYPSLSVDVSVTLYRLSFILWLRKYFQYIFRSFFHSPCLPRSHDVTHNIVI